MPQVKSQVIITVTQVGSSLSHQVSSPNLPCILIFVNFQTVAQFQIFYTIHLYDYLCHNVFFYLFNLEHFGGSIHILKKALMWIVNTGRQSITQGDWGHLNHNKLLLGSKFMMGNSWDVSEQQRHCASGSSWRESSLSTVASTWSHINPHTLRYLEYIM